MIFLIFPEFRLHIPCKSSHQEIICMQCQALFSGKNKNKILHILTKCLICALPF